MAPLIPMPLGSHQINDYSPRFQVLSGELPNQFPGASDHSC